MDTNSNSTIARTAFITGASAGIGAAFAERLAREGYDLILAARRGGRLEELAERLRAEHAVRVTPLGVDLADSAGLRQALDAATGRDSLSFLINNAGFGAYMPFVSLSPERAEELMRLQVLAVTLLTRAVLPGMIARGAGTIVNVSSRLAFSGGVEHPGMPKRAVYAASKAYVNAFTQILASELEGTGVRVQALCPGLVRTEFHLIQGVDPDRFPPGMVMPPEAVVEASLRGLEKGEIICIPPLEDDSLLKEEFESRRRLLANSGSGNLAKRYLP